MLLLSGPNLSGNEWKYVKDCLDTGWVSSVGSYVGAFEEAVARQAGCRFGVATTSGTAALHLALLLAGVQSGDYVILPNITFVASANSMRYLGADPLLVDVDAGNWQMDLDLLEEYLAEACERQSGGLYHKADGRRISAIMPVHVLGHMGDMPRLCRLAEAYGLQVVEDATEAMGSFFAGRHSGSYGLMGCFSFNGNKIVTCGGGGVLVTDDEGLARRAKHLTTQAKADAQRYFHDEVGFNYRLVNVSAAIGLAQMEQLEDFVERKQQIATEYMKALEGVGDIGFQQVVEGSQPNWWLFTVATERQEVLLSALQAAEIQARPLWVPMNRLPMYANSPYVQRNDRSAFVHARCLSLPCSTDLSASDLLRVVEVIRKAY